MYMYVYDINVASIVFQIIAPVGQPRLYFWLITEVMHLGLIVSLFLVFFEKK